MRDEYARFGEAGVKLVAISVDAVPEARGLAAKLKLPFPLLADPNRELTKAFGVFDPGNEVPWPVVFVIDKDGKVAWRDFLESYKSRTPIDKMIAAGKAANAG